MYLKTFDELKNSSSFFLLQPVKAIYAFIIIIFITLSIAITLSFFAPMDDIVKAPVLLRPYQTISSVRCISSGELVIKNYKNDDFVTEGELLLALDTTSLKTELDSYIHELEKNTEDNYINNILSSVLESSKLPEIDATSDAYIKSTLFLTEKKRLENSIEDIKLKLQRECSKPETLLIPQNIKDLENQLKQEELIFQAWINNQKYEIIEKTKQLEASRKNIETQISEIERNIKNSTIYAPISGRINEVTQLNIKDYIITGEEILRIIPQNDVSLKADIYVEPSFIAKINLGNSVKIKFSGLAPSKYGIIETTISLIPPDMTLYQQTQPVFIVEAIIDNPYLYTKNGQIAKLLPGITAEARIITDRCTVIQMILKKLDFWN